MKLILQTLLMITLIAFGSMVLAKTDADSPAPTTAQNVCHGVVQANSPPVYCKRLQNETLEICQGLRAATSSRANCAKVEGLAKVMCVGTVSAAAKNADCAKISGNEKAVCLGSLYAQACEEGVYCPERSCGDLEGLAQKVCWGVLHGSQFACQDLVF